MTKYRDWNKYMNSRCPVCGQTASEAIVNEHLDRGCPSTPKKPRTERQSTFSTDKRQSKTPPQDEKSIPKESTTKENKQPPLPGPAAKTASLNVAPLAERARPQTLDDYVGQKHLVGPDGVLRQLVLSDRIPSMVLWGPSGVGKTSFARVLAATTKSKFRELSATSAGSLDVKKVIDDARNEFRLLRRRTILFLDEIHRFNRAQQDSLLPAVERGDITLIGATTENPSFKLTSALLSRCRVFVLYPLDEEEVAKVVERALKMEERDVSPEIAKHIVAYSKGDGRVALNMLELALNLPPPLTLEHVREALRHAAVYDQRGDMHYDLISAFHKSVRGSDADAALYYVARMLQGGEDPLYLARRMVRIASEDVGLADDTCLPFAVAAHTAVQQIGMPEADAILGHCAVKLARAPKSVEVYKALGMLKTQLDSEPGMSAAAIPLHLRNAPTKLMSDLDYSKGYKYNPDYIGPVRQEYLPRGLPHTKWLGVSKPRLEDSS